MTRLDLPPIWLFLFVIAALLLDRLAPVGLLGPVGTVAGLGLGLAGLALAALAARRMRAAATTVLPHREPSALVTDGVFRLSRNPIYLADALILLGVLCWIDAPLLLPLVPAFMALLAHRFILPEEARLKRLFGPAYDDWAATTRRWI